VTKCVIKHTLAFIQFRKVLPHCKDSIDVLKDNFSTVKDRLYQEVSSVKNLVQEYKILKKIKKPKEGDEPQTSPKMEFF
jgi:hypothetical protein